MGLRLEYIISIIVALIFVSFFLINIEQKSRQKNESTKQLAFSDTRLIEVDTQKILGLAHSRYGVYENKTLILSDIIYHTDTVNLLQAQKGIYKGDYLFLEGNVTLNQKNGFDYTAQKAAYNQKSEVLSIESPFEAHMNKNIISGINLVYNMKEKKITAQKIKAVVFTLEK
ncbi:LPS export ABC transporter periplasmic protein LptC [Sulfurovum sp. zt1-1]|uniref:LPS export ABC transporter periplasmic protein LptC n=1 Tax=Sulfurovum zhangzhouensis TaxID=3019067 RepID=A0ABT7QUU9_9BACT|nr:LPS export ABC transporter periplasmic protein LptC [Sulfurovum zhangzhouensis]MDM5270619.1 LPS export ABC transporter periplasmic protein LptC [Sulfurovum zhangzhouensis]